MCQRTMYRILRDLEDTVAVFFDDIIVNSNTIIDHFIHLEQASKTIQENKIRIKGKKCKFFQTEDAVLGFIVGNGQLKSNPKKVEKMLSVRNPENLKMVK